MGPLRGALLSAGIVLSQVAFVLAGEPCAPFYTTNCQDTPMFYGNVDVFLARLNDPHGQSLVENALTGDLLLSTRNLDYDYEASPLVTFGTNLTNDVAVEGTYWGNHQWAATSTVLGDNDLTLPGAVPLATLDFFDADAMTVSQSAEVDNVEINLIPWTLDGLNDGNGELQLLAGVRYLRLDERLNINSFDIDSGASDYRIKTENDLWGGQLGARYLLQGCRCGLQTFGKIGVYNNNASQSQFIGDFDNTFTVRDTASGGNEVAMILEAGLVGTAKITDHMSLRAGYTSVWIHNVARASRQLDYSDTVLSGTALYNQSNAIVHGANLGIEWTW